MKSRFHSILIAAVFIHVLSAGGAWAQARYDNCSGQGLITNTITGAQMWGQNDPRSRSTAGTKVTLYGDAVSNFNWEDAVTYLKSTPSEIGKRVYVWQDCGQWRKIYGSPPFLKAECGNCGGSGGSDRSDDSDRPPGCPPGHTMILGNCIKD